MHGPNAEPPRRGRSPSPVYRVSHDLDGVADVSTTVAHALADCLGVDVTDATASLYDSVDPDALDALFRLGADEPTRASTTLSFLVRGYRVTVRGDGEVLIEPPTDPF